MTITNTVFVPTFRYKKKIISLMLTINAVYSFKKLLKHKEFINAII